MRKHLLSLGLLFFSLCAYSQSTIYVPQDFETIQDALDATSQGDTVLVSPGEYFENIVWPGNAIDVKLIGEEGSDMTIINGSDLASGILIQEEPFESVFDANVLIEGFVKESCNRE